MAGVIRVINQHRINMMGCYNNPDVKLIDIQFTHGSVVGNPWYKEGTRGLSKYRNWLWERYNAKGRVYLLINTIVYWLNHGKDVYLICVCKPKPCHGDIIIKAVNWVQTQSENGVI